MTPLNEKESEETKNLMNEMAIKDCVVNDEGILRQVGAFQPWYRKGFEAAHSLVEKEITTLKSEVKWLNLKHVKMAEQYNSLKYDYIHKSKANGELEKSIQDLKLQLADRSEKYKIAMDKGVDVLSSQNKDLTASLKSAVSAFNSAIEQRNEYIIANWDGIGSEDNELAEIELRNRELKAKHPDMFKAED
jgi:uncharacterized protein (DUF3084 family)